MRVYGNTSELSNVCSDINHMAIAEQSDVLARQYPGVAISPAWLPTMSYYLLYRIKSCLSGKRIEPNGYRLGVHQ